MSSQIAKLTAHSSHLLTAFIQLRERYSLLHPMLFDEKVAKQYGSWRQARGYTVLKSSLFLSCCQEIAKLTSDNFDKTPSISKLMTVLQESVLRDQLRDQYCGGRNSYAGDEEAEPELAEVYKRMAVEEAEQNRAEYEQKYAHAAALWAELSQSSKLKSFRNVRDKVTAHTELQFIDGQYRPVDIGLLDIKWGDLKTTIASMQELVEMLGQLIRDAGFAWESLDHMLTEAGNAFWCERSTASVADT